MPKHHEPNGVRRLPRTSRGIRSLTASIRARNAWIAAALIGVLIAAGIAISTASAAPADPVGEILESAVPSGAAENDANAVEVGIRFTPVAATTITGIRFYKDSRNTGQHTATLWSASGVQLANAVFVNESASGWQTATLDKPVAVAPGASYIASYHTQTGYYFDDEYTFADGATLGRRSLIGNSGVYAYGSGGVFPTDTWHQSQYYVDVTVGGTTTTSGTPTATPTTAATSSNPAPTTTPGSGSPAVGEMLASAIPDGPAANDVNPVELGIRFTPNSATSITGIRFYKDARNTGEHTATLWSASGTQLATATFTSETASGWQTAMLSKPIAVTPGVSYIASYHTQAGHYDYDEYAFAGGATLGQRSLKGTAGVFAYGPGSFPSSTWHQTQYYVDVTVGSAASPSGAQSTSTTSPAPTTSTSTSSPRPISSAPQTSISSTMTPAPTSSAATTTPPTGGATTPSGGFPDASNTGYRNAPGAPASLTTCKTPIVSNTTYMFCNFPNGLSVGTANAPVSNVTFIGSRFASNAVVDANVAVYGDNISFDYSSFEPSAVSSTPVAYRQGYQYGIDKRTSGSLTIDHSDFWGWGNGIQFGSSSQSAPLVVRNSWFHDARDDGGGIDHTDAILSNEGGPTYMVIDHNTIVSVGNTQGLALQTESRGYDHVTITNNYFSGFGYTVAIGETIACTNITFTGNVFGTDIKPVFGLLYTSTKWGTQGNVWSGNTLHVVPGSYYTNTADDGKFLLSSLALSLTG